jgi:hypothetical protein
MRAGAGGTQHHEPPEVAWALPEVEVGVELEVMPLEPVELEEEEPVLVELEEAPEEPVLVDPVEEPVLADPVEEDEPVEVRLVEASAVCVDPGRTKATALAATTLATPTVAVTTRIRARPRVLAVTASAIGPGCELELVMSFSLQAGARGPLQATSELPMNSDAYLVPDHRQAIRMRQSWSRRGRSRRRSRKAQRRPARARAGRKAGWIWGVLAELEAAGLITLADKSYQGSAYAKIPYRGQNKPESQKKANRAHAKLRSPGERANAQLKTWHILRKLRCCPWRAGQLTKAIHVLQVREA